MSIRGNVYRVAADTILDYFDRLRVVQNPISMLAFVLQHLKWDFSTIYNERDQLIKHMISVNVQYLIFLTILFQMEQSRFGSSNRRHLLLKLSAVVTVTAAAAVAAIAVAGTIAAAPPATATTGWQQCRAAQRKLLHGHQ